MIYPPCDSVFYRMNTNPGTIDIKKRFQINPCMTDDELAAIFDSFHIKNPDTLFTRVNEETEQIEQVRFADIIKQSVFQAGQLPTARLWLRRVPAGLSIAYADDVADMNGSRALFEDNCVIVSPEAVTSTVREVSVLLMHELAHAVDRHEITGMTAFPYNAVNGGSKMQYNEYNCSMSEAEYMQRFMIEEGEKHALSSQMLFEAGLFGRIYRYQKRYHKTYGKYVRIFKDWMPPVREDLWTDEEIITERMARTHYYTSMELMAGRIREFIKPYTHLFYKLSDKLEPAVCGSNLGPIIAFKKIKKAALTLPEIFLTGDVLNAMKLNLSYQFRAFENLSVTLKKAWRQKHNKKLAEMTASDWNAMNEMLEHPQERNQFMLSHTSEHFAEYTRRIEARYMGFIRAGELKPQLNPIAKYLKLNKSNLHQSVIDIVESYSIAQGLYDYFDDGIQNISDKYFVQRIVREHRREQEALQVNSSQKTRS